VEYCEQLDLLRGIGVLLVLYGHSLVTGPLVLNNLFTYAIYSFHMPLFFIISGFLYSKKGSYFEYSKKKFSRLMIPYIVNAMIIVIGNWFLGTYFNGLLLTGGKTDLIWLVYGQGAWFIFTLFCIFLLFPIIEIIKNRVGVIITLIILLILAMLTNNLYVFSINGIFYSIIYFYFGYLIKDHYLTVTQFVNKYKVYLIGLFLISPLFRISPVCGIDNEHNLFIKIFFALVGTALFYSIALKINNNVIKSILKSFSDYSLPLYLIGGIPTSLILIAINMLGLQQYFLSNILIFLIKTILGYLIVKYLIAPNSITRILFGIRKAA
jgi:fucose 4-O-acetylase-like acetyltransferase